MTAAFAPDHPGSLVRPSPNFGERRGFSRPDLILLHYTGMETGEAAEDRLCDPASEVSSHYLVHEDGRIVQMVRERDRAWHAGKSSWRGREDVNSRSIGIEIVNPGHEWGYRDFPDAQVEAVVALCLGLMARHGVAPHGVLAHSDVAPGRKVDPGERFPWARLAKAGAAVHVEPCEGAPRLPALRQGGRGEAVRRLQLDLARWGYGVEPTGAFDGRTAAAVAAFQRRFRSGRVDGVADPGTLATLRELLSRFG